LVLSDGSVFEGRGFGGFSSTMEPVVAEIVFNTSMSGYQEILTDPSYAGQAMCFTVPHIGNVGTNREDFESEKVHVDAVFVREHCEVPSNFRSQQTFNEFLKEHKTPAIAGIRTRDLTLHLRTHGAQMGAIGPKSIPAAVLQEQAKAAGSMSGKDYVHAVSCKESYPWYELPWDPVSNTYPHLTPDSVWKRPHVVVLDCGVKRNILRLLLSEGFRITVVPASTSASEIRELQPDGIFLSNGPGDPAALPGIIEMVKGILGEYPIFGICLGCQILAHALGGKTFKLRFGHRGANHPILERSTGKIEITSQNHGFAVDAESMAQRGGSFGSDEVEVTHLNLNDKTVSGIAVPSKKAFAVQFHPESSPGPHDSQHLFKRFFSLVAQ
ncbi:MAG: glutamine-hydrolyzing carbamoyl-phosphate synthase small subunit, partial [Bdellovibrionales bacterium]|nr:glutamine-hydrolyzing carbamoyl-phosphate synthase small subunit [Bdellovibrionales bacterium]